jgi:hypothetical protein
MNNDAVLNPDPKVIEDFCKELARQTFGPPSIEHCYLQVIAEREREEKALEA